MKKVAFFVLFLVVGMMWGEETLAFTQKTTLTSDFLEYGIGVAFPWDTGTSFWTKLCYGKAIDQALSIEGSIDYYYANRSEKLSNTTSGGVSTTVLESDVHIHQLKLLGGVRVALPWISFDPFNFFAQFNMGYSILWSFYSSLQSDQQLYFYAGDFISFQIMPGVLIPLGEKSQLTLGVNLDIASVSRSTPLENYTIKEKINLSGIGILASIGFKW